MTFHKSTLCTSLWREIRQWVRFAKDMTETEPQNRPIGYARVSTYGQLLDAQLEQLKAAGWARIYREEATGVRSAMFHKLPQATTRPAPWN